MVRLQLGIGLRGGRSDADDRRLRRPPRRTIHRWNGRWSFVNVDTPVPGGELPQIRPWIHDSYLQPHDCLIADAGVLG